MKKNILAVLIIFFIIHITTNAQEADLDVNTALQKIEGKSLDEIEKELDKGIKGMKAFMGFFQSSETEIKTYAKDEEVFSEHFKIDTAMVQIATKQFNNIGFLQTFKDHESYIKFLKIDDKYWNKVSLPEGLEESLHATKIYYKNGDIISDQINNNKISFFWEEKWGDPRVIDSIEIDYTISYTKTYDSIRLDNKTKKLPYKEGFVKVKKLEGNHVYITISDAYANGLYLKALNSDDKPLNETSSSYAPTSNNNSEDELSEMISLMEDLQDRLQKDKFKDTEQLKKYLSKQLPKIEKAKDNDGVGHLRYYFNGNIASLILYFETERTFRTIPFTAINNNRFKSILINETEERIIFMDTDANEIFGIDNSPIERIGNRFFIEDETYYYINTATKSLDSIDAVKIFETINELVFIQKDNEHDFLVLDTYLKQLSEMEFTTVWSINEHYTHALDKDNINYVIDKKGDIKKIEGVSETGDISEGLIIARLDDKYGFINPAGDIVVPLIYKDVKLFNEGLAAVTNEEGLVGYIRTDGSIVLPLIYQDGDSFENGITMVSTPEGYQLINKKGEVIVDSKSHGYSISGSGLQKTYLFGAKKYDAFGKLILTKDKN